MLSGDSLRPTRARATWLFLRFLGLIYLAAFWSLDVQILGLVGHGGIVPADVSDAALKAACLAGMALAVLVIAGIAPVIILALLWADYFFLSQQCVEFLSYQWDALLLEVGGIAVFMAPWVWRERLSRLESPPRAASWLALWLLFRLMVASGAVKLASGDPSWRDLSALAFHFETQPIPTPLAWYAHLLPRFALKVLTALTLALELGAPLLMLGPRRLRIAACILLVGLQATIALTGNYAFFNLLTAALCLFLLDDRSLGRWGAVQAKTTAIRWRTPIVAAAAAVTVPVSLFLFAGSFGVQLPGAAIVLPVAQVVMPLRVVNRYGLFAVMTTSRPEIIVEGSTDGEHWQEYEFKYKAGDRSRRPPWVAPHQPRLDWQMWFAALGEFRSELWFQRFCDRLLEADPSVLALLAHDPFGGRKPAFVRAVLYDYKFADWSTGRRDHVWWTRERIADYSPVLSLEHREGPALACPTPFP